MEYDLRKLVLEVLREDILPLMQTGKDRFTADDIAARYGMHKDNARQMMRNGDFGEVITATDRHKVVTLEGVLAYEARCKGIANARAAKTGQLKSKKTAVGRI